MATDGLVDTSRLDRPPGLPIDLCWCGAMIIGDLRLQADLLASIQTPALVIEGEQSPLLMRAAARAVADALPNGRLSTVADGATVAKTKPPFADAYESIRRRRGRQIATTAIARRLLAASFHILKEVNTQLAADRCAG